MVLSKMKAELRCVSLVNGRLFVMITGVRLKHKSCVDNLDILIKVKSSSVLCFTLLYVHANGVCVCQIECVTVPVLMF